MAYALVGTIGTAVQGASGSALTTLAWGTGETRTAGNLLICFCSVTGVATLPTTPANWSIGKQVAGTSCSTTIYYKIAAGTDAAPTINAITGGTIAGQLAEFSGNSSTPLDQTGSATGTTSPLTATFAAASKATTDLILMSGADFRSASRTSNDTWTSNHATITQAGNNNGNSANHYSFGYATSLSSVSGADTAIMTCSSTTSVTGLAIVGASFKAQITSSQTGSLSFSANIDSFIGKILSATILSFIGGIDNYTSRLLSGVTSFVGNLFSSRLRMSALSSTVSFITNIDNFTTRTFTAISNFIGSTVKTTSKTTGAVISFVGVIKKGIQALRPGTLSFTGISKRNIKHLLTPAVLILSAFFNAFKQGGAQTYQQAVSSTLILVGTTSKTLQRLLIALVSFSGMVVRLSFYVASGVISLLGSLSNLPQKLFSAIINVSGSISRSFSYFLDGIINFVSDFQSFIPTTVNVLLESTLTLYGFITRRIPDIVKTAISSTVTTIKVVIKSIRIVPH